MTKEVHHCGLPMNLNLVTFLIVLVGQRGSLNFRSEGYFFVTKWRFSHSKQSLESSCLIRLLPKQSPKFRSIL